MAGKCRGIPIAPTTAVIVAVLMAVAVTGVVQARDSSGNPSSLLTWSGPGCSGDWSTIGTCGCTDLPYHGGQEFYYRGEIGTLYTDPGCVGFPYQMNDDFTACDEDGWRSIHILCCFPNC